MKLLSTLIFAFVFCSCVENTGPLVQEDLGSEVNPLIGKWQLVESSYSVEAHLFQLLLKMDRLLYSKRMEPIFQTVNF